MKHDRLTFDTYEEGKLTLEENFGQVVCYKKRTFTRVLIDGEDVTD
jgi:hypothetical protein